MLLRVFLVFALILVVMSGSSVPLAHATSGDVLSRADAEVARWEGQPGEEVVRELFEGLGLVVVRPPDRGEEVWSVADLVSIAAGARALPGAVWQSLERPLFIERRNQACLFGMGRYSSPCPTFDRKKRTFYIYDLPSVMGEGGLRHFQLLTAEEARDIQRRRAVVHFAMSLLDSQERWSREQGWRGINGWPQTGWLGAGEALNKDPWGYSRYLGQRSAHLDFVTFAEEYFVRPEDILRDSDAPDALSRLAGFEPDMRLDCQQFTKIRFLATKIAALDPRWSPPVRDLPPGQSVRCPAFEQWANFANLAGIDILLAAATSDRPQSLYGHLLLHVRYKADKTVVSEGFEPVYQFGAITDTDVHPIEFFARGLMGGFSAVLEVNTFRGIDRIFLQYEQRTLQRFGLNLSPTQSLHLLQRIWEAERHIRYPYVFLSKNCASFILDLVEPAFDLRLPERNQTIVMPTDVLDHLANINNGTRGPLLEKHADDLLSNRETAQRAIRARRTVLANLIERLDADTSQVARLKELDSRLDATAAPIRRDAYQELRTLVTQMLDAHVKRQDTSNPGSSPTASRLAIDYLYYCTRIERYFMDVANFAKREVMVGAQLDVFRMSAEELLELRRDVYRDEDLEARRQTRNQWAHATDQHVLKSAKRDFTAPELEVINNEALNREAYLAVLDAQSEIIGRFKDDWSGVAYLAEKSEGYQAELRQRDELSKRPSGKGRWLVGVGMGDEVGDGALSPGRLDFSYSYMYDRLGELRRRGYRSDIESRTLSLQLEAPMTFDGYKHLNVDLIVFRYMSIEQKMGPVRQSWSDLFGWGTDVRFRHDGRRGLYFGAEFMLAYLYPIWTSAHGATHLVAGLGAELRADVTTAEPTFLGGVQGQVIGQKHLYGKYANVLRLELKAGQLLNHFGQPRYDVAGELSTEHALFDVGQYQLILKPHVSGLYSTVQYLADQTDLRTWKAGLSVELPF